MKKKKRKSKIQIVAESKIYSQFFTGLAIAWFTGSVVSPLLNLKIEQSDVVLVAFGIIVSVVYLRLAIKYEERT